MSPVQGPFPHPFPPLFGSPVLDCFLRDLPTSLRAFPSSDSQGYVQGNQTYEVHQTSARLSQEGLIPEVSRKNNPDGDANKQLEAGPDYLQSLQVYKSVLWFSWIPQKSQRQQLPTEFPTKSHTIFAFCTPTNKTALTAKSTSNKHQNQKRGKAFKGSAGKPA